MSELENFSFSFSENPILLIFGVLLLIFYSIYVYRITLPQVNLLKKTLLIFLRTFALLLIFVLLFDPIIKFTYKEKTEPETLVFIDNSSSVKAFNRDNDLKRIKSLTDELKSSTVYKLKFFSFGKEVNEIENFTFDSLTFSETSTNLQLVFDEIKENKNISSLVIISDGIINEGLNPLYVQNNFLVPAYVIGLGDTTEQTEISIENITHNKFIYAGRTTQIEVAIKNLGLIDKDALIQFIDEKGNVEQKIIKLSRTQIDRVKFEYLTNDEGEHKLTFKVSVLDINIKLNHSKSTFIRVLPRKKKITIIGGAPSKDLSAIKSSLDEFEDFDVESIIQINKENFYSNNKDFENISNSDVLFLIGIPNQKTDPNLISIINNEIESKNKPFFFLPSIDAEFSAYPKLKFSLPFKFEEINKNYVKVQPKISTLTNNLLGSDKSTLLEWSNLPPVDMNKTKIITNKSAEILLEGIIDISNQIVPLIFSNNINNNKSLIITASNIWKWKTQASKKELLLFNNFVLNSVKWLTIKNEDEQFTANPIKKSFKIGESVIFNSNLYNEVFEPVNNAKIILEIKGDNYTETFNFYNISPGLYETKTEIKNPGRYSYSAKLFDNNVEKKSINGIFEIEPIELEYITKKMDKVFLKNLAQQSGGKYFNITTTENLNNLLQQNFNERIIYIYTDKELRLSSFELILVILVLLFAFEWFLRKYFKMI